MLKRKHQSSVLIHVPDFFLPFVLQTNVLVCGLGAVLSQVVEKANIS